MDILDEYANANNAATYKSIAKEIREASIQKNGDYKNLLIERFAEALNNTLGCSLDD